MAQVLACDICGAIGDPNALPPFVEPAEWRNAIDTYSGTICQDCQRTATIATVMEKFRGAPGGTVDGPDRGPYLVLPET